VPVLRHRAKGLDAVLHGDLARILQLCEAADGRLEASCEFYGIIAAKYERLIGPIWSSR
jgi:hypothetical protein